MNINPKFFHPSPWRNSLKPKAPLTILLAWLLATPLHATEVSPLRETIAMAHKVLADVSASPAEQDQLRDELRNLLQKAKSKQEKGLLLNAIACDTFFFKQNIRAAIPLWEDARTLLSEGSEDWIQATFGLAMAVQNQMPASRETLATAHQLYLEILKHDSTSGIAARTLLNLGRIHEMIDFAGDQQDHAKARAYYEQVLTGWPNDPIAQESALRFGSTFLQEAYFPEDKLRTNWNWRIEQMHRAIQFLKEWVSQHPEASLAPGIWEIIGNIYLVMPDYQNWKVQAMEAFLHSTGDEALLTGGDPVPHKTNMDRIDTGYLYLRIAALAHQTGNRAVALEYYTRLMTEADSYQRGPEAALQLIHNLGFSKEEVIERATWQFQILGYELPEARRLIEQFEFLDAPMNLSVPAP